jgi:hypothetical protein
MGISMKSLALFLLALIVCAVPALADVNINSPVQNSKVVSPFLLSATASKCSSQPIASMSYWIDTGPSTTINGSSITAQVASTTEAHTVHVTSLGKEGAVCQSSVAIWVVPDPASQVPGSASSVNNIQALSTWQGTSDTAIPGGTASGTTKIVASPSLSGSARQFSMQFTNYGGERYWVVFGSNPAATHFLYDGWVYLARPSGGIGNLELDTDQVMSNGDTVIYGFQCDGYSGTWDYTENASSTSDRWVNSNYGCNPRSWSTNVWHHVQIAYSRDDTGSVTYHSVWFDGVEEDINDTVPSDYPLGWSTVLLTNLQIDGYRASGSATVYLDRLTIYSWQ